MNTSFIRRPSPGLDALQTAGVLSALIFLVNCTFEVLVMHGLYSAQYLLISLLLWALAVWALWEVAVMARQARVPLSSLNAALCLQLAVAVLRHTLHAPVPEALIGSSALVANLDIGLAAVYGPVYLIEFLLIGKLLINTFSYAERVRANQLEEQIAINQRASDALAQSHAALNRANAELSLHRDNLETLVLQRTLELATARAESDSANAVKTRFMANVSQEMRTPLQGILGYTELAKCSFGDASPQDMESYLDSILAAGTKMHKLVEALLTLANQSWADHAGPVNVGNQQVDVLHFSHGLGTLMEYRASRLGQNLVTDIQAPAVNVVGEHDRLQQVFEHLLGNAFRYSSRGDTTLLRVRKTLFKPAGETADKEAVMFEIIDQGCGIPESEISAVFEPFYESTRTATGVGGTGLGLPLSKCIVGRYGGTIALANRPEGGLACRVTLPTAPIEVDDPSL